MTSQGLPKACRLKKRRLIRPLFDRGRGDVWSVAHGCVRIVAREVSRSDTGEDVAVQIGFSPGRGVKRAVDRNLIKRVLREVYRLNQGMLVDLFIHSGRTLTAMILFRGEPSSAPRSVPADLPVALDKARRRVESSLARSHLNPPSAKQ